MIIHYLACKPFGRYRGKLFSPLASVRLRALEVAPHLVKLGHHVRVVPFDDLARRLEAGGSPEADVYVVQKALNDVGPLLRVLRRAGRLIVVDLCDNVLLHPRLRNFYPSVIGQADLVTVSSRALGAVMQPHLPVPVVYIPDCVELPRGVPSLPEPADPVRLLWFGRSDNVAALLDQIPDLAALSARRPCTLDVVCDVPLELDSAFDRWRKQLPVSCIEWSLESLETALACCHFAIMPGSGDACAATKSANRLQETLWAGRLPVAHHIDGYSMFSDAAVLCEGLVDGIDWALSNRDIVPARIALGQQLIEDRFTPLRVADLWDKALRAVTGNGGDAVFSTAGRVQ